jgi:hypothetical protein
MFFLSLKDHELFFILLLFIFLKERIKKNSQEKVEKDEIANEDPADVENDNHEFVNVSSHRVE